MKYLAAILAIAALAGCRASLGGVEQTPSSAPVHLAQCEGPAYSLPDSLARTLRPRTGRMIPDDRWADLATTVPGGFAGVIRDSTHTLLLLLRDTTQAAAARQALDGKLGFPLQQARVRQVRWDFAQLVEWFNYLLPRLGVDVTADKDEVLNRVRFSATSIAQRDSVVRALAKLQLPCDLVVVDLGGLTPQF